MWVVLSLISRKTANLSPRRPDLITTRHPVVDEDPPQHRVRLHRSEIWEWGQVLIKHVAICPPPSSRHWQPWPKPAISTKWSRPTINKPLEVFYSPTDLSSEQNMNCARPVFTQLKRLYLRHDTEWVVEHVCILGCGKNFWIYNPRSVGTSVGGGSGSGFCLRILNILIFVFRSVQTEQISRRGLAPDKLIKKKQTSRAAKKSLDPTWNRYFWRISGIWWGENPIPDVWETHQKQSFIIIIIIIRRGRQRLITKPAFIVIPCFAIHEIIVKADFGYESSKQLKF